MKPAAWRSLVGPGRGFASGTGRGLVGRTRIGQAGFARWAASPPSHWPHLRLARLRCERESVLSSARSSMPRVLGGRRLRCRGSSPAARTAATIPSTVGRPPRNTERRYPADPRPAVLFLVTRANTGTPDVLGVSEPPRAYPQTSSGGRSGPRHASSPTDAADAIEPVTRARRAGDRRLHGMVRGSRGWSVSLGSVRRSPS